VDRRGFLMTSLAGALAAPRAGGAQPVGKVYRLGILSPGGHPPPGWSSGHLHLKDQSARLLFDLPGAGRSDRHWTFVGRVDGDTAGVGVWLAIEEIVNPEGMITSAPGPYTVLIRWEWIVTAVLMAEKPIDPKSVKIVGTRE
jgi:hypothetical protein